MADLDEPIHVVAPDPAWGDQGRTLVHDISAALRGLPVDVAHIGSTAVPGLEAKPGHRRSGRLCDRQNRGRCRPRRAAGL
ncbi:GrpB family protein [Streptomyces sp. NPDC048564]|uniref:GrpB family protein n=1 Tax=Streptomyces sp. NPDC048564 TaxID=3155760 RepID=UPI00342C12F2